MKSASAASEEQEAGIAWLVATPFLVLVLSAANLLLSWKVDFLIAEASGAILTNSAGWKVFTSPEWMFGSLLGPTLAIHPALFLFIAILSGCAAAWLIIQSVRIGRVCRSRVAWTLFLLLWLVRLPLPEHWTLYHFAAVAY